MLLNVNPSWLQIYSREGNGITISCGIAPDSIVIKSCRQVGKGSLRERGCDLTDKEREKKQNSKETCLRITLQIVNKNGNSSYPS